MTAPRTISFRIAAAKIAQLDRLAKSMDRNRSYLLNEAVGNYLDEQQRFASMVEEGRNDLRNGRAFSHEEVERMADEWESAAR
jgi:predicted transcriptional regulator